MEKNIKSAADSDFAYKFMFDGFCTENNGAGKAEKPLSKILPCAKSISLKNKKMYQANFDTSINICSATNDNIVIP